MVRKLQPLVDMPAHDVIWASRGSHGPRFGIDFSRNLGSAARTALPFGAGHHGHLRAVPQRGRIQQRGTWGVLRPGPSLGQRSGACPARPGRGAGLRPPNVGQNDAYLRVSQKEPFDILYLTPAVTLITNTGDQSWTVIAEVLCTGFRNIELRARAQVNVGGQGTEFGEKAVRTRLELRARLFY
jgi:hypothetical protein